MSTDRLITAIELEISKNGGNRHPYPLSLGLSKGLWSVVIEVDNRQRTFDVETEDASLPVALKNALGALRRAFA